MFSWITYQQYKVRRIKAKASFKHLNPLPPNACHTCLLSVNNTLSWQCRMYATDFFYVHTHKCNGGCFSNKWDYTICIVPYVLFLPVCLRQHSRSVYLGQKLQTHRSQFTNSFKFLKLVFNIKKAHIDIFF